MIEVFLVDDHPFVLQGLKGYKSLSHCKYLVQYHLIWCPKFRFKVINVAPTDIVRTLKSISAIKLFKEYPKLKKFYARCGSLWSKGYFVSTIGNVSSHTIKKYIQNQNSN